MIFNAFPGDYNPASAYNVKGLMPWRLNTILSTNLLQSSPLGSSIYDTPPMTPNLPHGGYMPLGQDDASASTAGVTIGVGFALTIAIVAAMWWTARD